MNYKHGHTWRGGVTPIYRAWRSMNERCYRISHLAYHRYGGRGITVCSRWRNSFEAFAQDIGVRPEGTSLGRIDNDGNYEPSNCCWQTKEEQDNNKCTNVFFTHQGSTLTLQQWARKTGIKQVTLHARIFRYGWTPERALTTAPRVLKSKE
jgi:hypothetical protein